MATMASSGIDDSRAAVSDIIEIRDRVETHDHSPGAPRERAFLAAGRHSTRVRRMRRLFMLAAIGGPVLVVVFGLVNPFRILPKQLTLGAIGLNGSRITMELPKLSGFRSDGRPYTVRAASGVQDAKQPDLIELNALEAQFTDSDGKLIDVSAARGLYDTKKELMDLSGGARIRAKSGYDVVLKSAHLDFKAGSLVSLDPVTMVMTGGTVAALSVAVADSGARVTFEGDVRTVMKADRADAGLRAAAP